jgi:hypothetical protein
MILPPLVLPAAIFKTWQRVSQVFPVCAGASFLLLKDDFDFSGRRADNLELTSENFFLRHRRRRKTQASLMFASNFSVYQSLSCLVPPAKRRLLDLLANIRLDL